MKKIINGRVYNTDTAGLVGMWNNESAKDNAKIIRESLYKKHNHEFFIHKVVIVHDDKTNAEYLFPITYDEAKSFAKAKLKAEEYAAVFEVPETGDTNETITIKVTLTRTAKRLIDSEARRTNGTIGGIISRLAETLR